MPGDRIGNLFPRINNCRGGMDGDTLHGCLTADESGTVENFPVEDDPAAQQALILLQNCVILGREAEIAYFPEEGSEDAALGIVVSAACVTECQYRID